jgi:hypothetical protein
VGKKGDSPRRASDEKKWLLSPKTLVRKASPETIKFSLKARSSNRCKQKPNPTATKTATRFFGGGPLEKENSPQKIVVSDYYSLVD